MVGERRQRSDKKVDVKATMSLILKRQLYTLAEKCEMPVKDIAEQLCVQGCKSQIIITEISKWLRRNYVYGTSIVIGDIERPRLKLKAQGETGKASMRFKQRDYDKLTELAFALDLTPSSTATVLIRVALFNEDFMRLFIDTLKFNDTKKVVAKRYLRQIWNERSKV